jgi:hypothetical protein
MQSSKYKMEALKTTIALYFEQADEDEDEDDWVIQN